MSFGNLAFYGRGVPGRVIGGWGLGWRSEQDIQGRRAIAAKEKLVGSEACGTANCCAKGKKGLRKDVFPCARVVEL